MVKWVFLIILRKEIKLGEFKGNIIKIIINN